MKPNYRIVWDCDDAQYVALCDYFPSLSWLAEPPGDALAGLISIITDIAQDKEKP